MAQTTRPRIFIGSSSEGLETATMFGALLADESEVSMWNKNVFHLGHNYLASLVQIQKQCDFAVLVLTPDDLIRTRYTEQMAPRDNVLFECGLFMGGLGPERTFLAFDRTWGLKVPSDLDGISVADFDSGAGGLANAVAAAAERINDRVRTLGKLRPDPPSFWRPFIDSPSTIALGRFSQFNSFEASGMLGVGDAACLATVAADLRGRYGFNPAVGQADLMSGEALGHSLIIVGGPDNNSIAREMFKRIRTGLQLGNPDANEISFRSAITRRTYVPRAEDGEVLTDYGVILRAPNPFAPERRVLLLFGCYGFGTWAAAKYVCSDEFLALQEVKAGVDLVCVVRADIVRDVPIGLTCCELRALDANAAMT